NLGPPRPSALGEFDIGAGPSIGGVGLPAAKVLTSPDEIDQMVARSISARGRQVTACYESRLKTVEDLAGIWSISFVVNPDGTTSGVKVKGQSARDDTLESCLKRKVSGWRFQKIAKPHPVTVPFNFSPT
ncbi:MAG: AgmX/PglI C-terminal domain-containing protein, partial [Myxococcota bacterium]